MVYQHGTPYVTPHILHKHYAQAFDAETNNREYSAPEIHVFTTRPPVLTLLVCCSRRT